MAISLTEIKGIGNATAEKLKGMGFMNANDIASSSVDKLAAVSGFGLARAAMVIECAGQLLKDELIVDPEVEHVAKTTEKSETSVKKKVTHAKKKKSKKEKKKAKALKGIEDKKEKKQKKEKQKKKKEEKGKISKSKKKKQKKKGEKEKEKKSKKKKTKK